MRQAISKVAVLLSAMTFAVSSYAVSASTTYNNTFTIQPTPYVNSDPWKFQLIPYIWAVNMNGRVGVGPIVGHVNQSFNDILSDLNFATMVAAEATNDRFTAFINIVYAVLSNNADTGAVSVHVKNNFGLYSGGIAYSIFKYPFNFSNNGMANSLVELSPYAGFRYTLNEVDSTLNAEGLQLSSNLNQYWTDPIVGLRLNYDINRAWKLMLAGDIGGMNASSQYSYNAFGTIGYSPHFLWSNTTIYLGYRTLGQHYTTGSGLRRYDWNMKVFGPLVGLGIEF